MTEVEADEVGGFLADITEQSSRSASYGRDIRGVVRAQWSGAIDIDQAFDIFSDTVRIGLTRAWHEGAAECGIQPSELTPQERAALTSATISETSRIWAFLQVIEQNNKASGGSLAPLLSRAGMWALRYDDVVTRAKLMACADQKLEWVQGPTSDKCPTCTRMNGKVKRASQWAENGVHPRQPPNATIQCHGWRCLCTFEQTDKPLSKGPLPRWP